MPSESQRAVLGHEVAPLVCAEPGSSVLTTPQAQRVQAASDRDRMIKLTSLTFLCLQNSASYVVVRYTRTLKGPMYSLTVIVLLSELCKMAVCTSMIVSDAGGLAGAADVLREAMPTRDTLRLSVPSLCYAFQNNLNLIAVTHLPAAVAQVVYQAKTLTTAAFSALLLGRRFTCEQWLSFLLLIFAVVMVQDSAHDAHSATNSPQKQLVGFASSLTSALFSGFAGVYLELMFTSGGASLWVRNVQLGVFAIPLQAAAVWQQERHHIAAHGPLRLLHGFHLSTWFLVLMMAAGGLATAIVIKYAGNMLKIFTTVVSLLITCVISVPFFGLEPTREFVMGIAATVVSMGLYSQGDGLQRLLKSAAAACQPEASSHGKFTLFSKPLRPGGGDLDLHQDTPTAAEP